MLVRPISRLALVPALVSVLTVGNLVPPAEAAPPSHAEPSRSPAKRHRPAWMRALDFVAHGMPGRGPCGDFGCSAPCRYSAGEPDPVGGLRPTITIERFEGLTFCFGGFTSRAMPMLKITTLDGGVFSAGGEGSDDVTKNAFSWDLSAQRVTAAMSRPGTYRYEVTAVNTPTTSGYIEVKPADAPTAFFSNSEATGPLGTGSVVTATVGGYPPGSPILTDLYGTRGDRFRMELVEDLPPVTADENGEAVIHWTVMRETPSGEYAMLVEPAPDDEPECGYRCTDFDVLH